MAITVTINPDVATIKFGESQKFSAVVADAPVDATLAYVWKVDGSVVQADAGSNGLSATITPDALGAKAVTVDVTATAEGTEPATASGSATLTVNKADQTPFNAVLTVSKDTAKVGEVVTAEVTVTGQMAGAAISYKWETGETTASITVPTDTTGKKTPKCEITSKLANYNDVKVSRSKTITITEDVPAGETDYIHPLPHIKAGFIWVGYWVMDEIEKLTKEGKDWKTPEAGPYQTSLLTLVKLLNDYELALVQESRHGIMVSREQLDTGKIYDKISNWVV